MLQCMILPAENNWTNIDFYVAIIVTFSINRSLYAHLFGNIPLYMKASDWFLTKTHIYIHTHMHMYT